MAGRDAGRSRRIVEAATRVIALTAGIDEALDRADAMVGERRETMKELARLTNVTVGSYQSLSIPLVTSAADAILIALLTSERVGMNDADLLQASSRRLGHALPEGEFGKALALLEETGEVTSVHGRWRAIRKAARRGGQASSPRVVDMIVEVLARSSSPLGVAAIRDAILERFGENVARTTISPFLGRRQGGTRRRQMGHIRDLVKTNQKVFFRASPNRSFFVLSFLDGSFIQKPRRGSRRREETRK